MSVNTYQKKGKTNVNRRKISEGLIHERNAECSSAPPDPLRDGDGENAGLIRKTVMRRNDAAVTGNEGSRKGREQINHLGEGGAGFSGDNPHAKSVDPRMLPFASEKNPSDDKRKCIGGEETARERRMRPNGNGTEWTFVVGDVRAIVRVRDDLGGIAARL